MSPDPHKTRTLKGVGVSFPLARQLGRSPAWLSLLERGKIAATPPQVGEILAVLGAQFEHSKRGQT